MESLLPDFSENHKSVISFIKAISKGVLPAPELAISLSEESFESALAALRPIASRNNALVRAFTDGKAFVSSVQSLHRCRYYAFPPELQQTVVKMVSETGDAITLLEGFSPISGESDKKVEHVVQSICGILKQLEEEVIDYLKSPSDQT